MNLESRGTHFFAFLNFRYILKNKFQVHILYYLNYVLTKKTNKNTFHYLNYKYTFCIFTKSHVLHLTHLPKYCDETFGPRPRVLFANELPTDLVTRNTFLILVTCTNFMFTPFFRLCSLFVN